MKNNISCKKVIGITLIAILVLTANVYAVTDSFKTTLSVDNSKVKRGDTIKVTIALSDIAIESGEKGIGAYTAKLDFDSSILEYDSTNGTDKWESPFYNDSRIVGNTKDGEVIKTAQDIGTITFKVKKDAKLGETTIKLTNFSGSTAESNVSAKDASVKITIEDKKNENGNTNTDPGTNGSENPGTNEGENSGTNEGENPSTNEGENAGTSGNAGTNGSTVGNSNNQNGKGNNKVTGNKSNEDNIKPGVLPQTGDTNIELLISTCICTLLAIGILVRIKILNRKIEKSSDITQK